MSNMRTLPSATYRDALGLRHEVIVEHVEEGWEIADVLGDERQVIDRLTDERDTRECAEAVARDWASEAVKRDMALSA
jgi:hypothetical protein